MITGTIGAAPWRTSISQRLPRHNQSVGKRNVRVSAGLVDLSAVTEKRSGKRLNNKEFKKTRNRWTNAQKRAYQGRIS